MKKENKILKIGFSFLKKIGITVCVFALIIYVLPYFFKEEINTGIKDISKNYIKTDVAFNELDVSFFNHFPKLTVTLQNTTLQGAQPFLKENVIEAKEIALGVDVTSLLSDQIVFNELYIDQAAIHLKIDSLGRSNFDIMVPSEEVEQKETSSVGLVLNEIKISNSKFTYEDQSSKTYLDFKEFDYEGLIDFKDNVLKLDADTQINNTLFKVDQETYVKNLPLKGKVNTTIDLNDLSFNFIDNQLILGQFPFDLKGVLKMPGAAQFYDLTVTSTQNNLQTIVPIIPEAYQEYVKDFELKGSSDLNFQMKGWMNPETNQNPDIKIKALVNNGEVNYKQSKSPIEQLNLISTLDLPALDPNQLKVNVENLEFKLLDGKTKTNFTYWAGETMFSEGEITSKVDLEALKNAIGFQPIDAKGVLEVEGNWKGSLVNAANQNLLKVPTFQIKANLANGYFKMKEMPAAIDQFNLELEAANLDGNYKNTSILIHHIDVKALNNNIKGQLKVKNLSTFPVDADFNANVHLEDIYKIYPLKRIDLRGDLFAQIKANGTYEPNKKRVPVTNSILKVKNGYLRFDDLPTLPLENISIETHVKSGRGSFKDLSIKVLPISFQLAGKPFMINADLKDFNHLDYRIHSKGELKLGDIYKLFPIEGLDLDGKITANVGLKGSNGAALNSMQNRGFIQLENITIHTNFFPSDFKVKEGMFKFNTNQLTFENVKARYKRNVFNFNGKVSNYINYALKENELLTGEINFKTNKVNINDFMAFNTGETANQSSNSGVVLLPTNLNLKMKGQANSVVYNDLTLENFKGDLCLNKGNLELDQTQFNLIGSTFNLQGAYRPLHAKKAKFSFDIEGNNFDIQRAYKEIALFREMASAAEKAHGKISLDYYLEGHLGADMFPKLKTVKGEGDLIAEDIQFMGFKVFNAVADKTSTEALHDAKLKNVKIHTSIENNVMTIHRTKFKVAGFRPRIEGQVTLDGYMNVGMRLGLPPFGIIGIPIRITGPADTFEVEVGKYHQEDLDETDDEFADYQKAIEEEKAKAQQK